MEISEKNGFVELTTEDDFDLEKIFECGQCFRWNRQEDESYIGVAMGRAARISKRGNTVYISGTMEDYENVWREYFDLDRDYRSLRRQVAVDGYMKSASDFGAGIRLLNQDRWETLCSFIISQCNNIPRIKGIVERLSALYGREISFEGKTYYSFPGADVIAPLTVEDLAPIRSGYRAGYIIEAARAVDSGKISLEELSGQSLKQAKAALMALPGIGEKVANCVILFSLRIPSAFPIDVWMKKAISQHYPHGFDPGVFGENAGLAQQYMFYFQRSGGANNP